MKEMTEKYRGSVYRFVIVGIINTVVGTAIMFCLYNLCGCSYWVSSAANYILASILSYVLNRKFTFRFSGSTVKSSVRFAVNIASCYLIAYGAAKPLASYCLSHLSITAQENIAMIIGMVIFTGLNYLGQKYFVFGERR